MGIKKKTGLKVKLILMQMKVKLMGTKPIQHERLVRHPLIVQLKVMIKIAKKNTKSACSMNTVVNSFDEHQSSLPGITLPARFKKANNKNKKSTIRKSDLRNNGCGSDTDEKVSK